MGRFDNRTKDQFKKDIYFGTMLEKYFMEKIAEHDCISNVRDNGVGNDGGFIESGVNTSGADYMVDIEWNDEEGHGGTFNLPLEVKWVPTYGKFTLKVNDLKAYIREKAAILFIYTNKYLPLKKPRDHDLKAHIKLIEHHSEHLRWGIMFPDTVKSFLECKQDEIKKIPYMGNKLGIVLPQSEFGNWIKEEKFL